MAERAPFDLLGPLPLGLTVLEASAGTGKTYALSALAVRYVAELGVPVSSLCIVSFTEAATAELRGRVRQRLVEVVAALEAGDDAADEVIGAITAGVDLAERRLRLERLRVAINDFDAATITTIHGFCGRLLAMGGDGTADGPITRSSADVDEAVHDLLLACAGPAADDVVPIASDLDLTEPALPKRLASGVQAMLRLPDAVMWRPPEPAPARAPATPSDTQPPTSDKERAKADKERAKADKERAKVDKERERVRSSTAAADLVEHAHAMVVERRQRSRRRTLDRVVVDARDLLLRPTSHGLVSALRQRYRVVLIDEFQDTDRVQWDLFRRAFVGGPDAPAVVLVGDPKQSIYRFRGAELEAYLDAVAQADAVRTLQRNWRSDAPMLRGLERLLDGVTFGSDEVVFQPVDAAPDRDEWRLRAAATVVAAPVDLRIVPRRGDTLDAPTARRAILADLVRTVAGLLDGGAAVVGADGATASLRARDIAVLTRSNNDATNVVAALAAAGIAAATSGATSVTTTEAWAEWRRLLVALERPGSASAVRAAAAGWFGGLTLGELALLDDTDVADLHDRFRSWAALVATRGIPALLAAARARGLQARLLARYGGERDLTDLEHIAELLQGVTGGRPTPPGMLRRLVDDPNVVGDSDDAESLTSRRIDRDDDAVQVLTAHRAKGLEFPVVLCPFMWSAGGSSQSVEHADIDGRRTISSAWIAGAKPSALKPLQAAIDAEKDGEQRRLVYVALTRARHSCVVWWAPLPDQHTSVLGDILGAAAGAAHRPKELADLRAIADGAAGSVAVGEVVPAPAVRRTAASVATTLEVAVTDRVLDTAWRIWSFSAIKAAGEGLEHDRPVVGGADEPSTGTDDDPDEQAILPAAPGPLATAPGGTEFGTLVHQVLEEVDFTSATLLADLTERCALALRHRSLRIAADELAAGLVSAIGAPLGGPLGSTRLADLSPSQRLNELVFDLHLGRFSPSRIGAVLVDHLMPDDPLLGWARALAGGHVHLDLEGMLTGSIDLVARTVDGRGFWVADYKTNQLGRDSSYGQGELVAAMVHHDYPLQAALYLVALHRFLRWRQPGYDPARHLLGAAYLFVRGMVPTTEPTLSTQAAGVFWWRPPVGAIVALDHLLATGATR
jgi:exodeoxyribonuclease V beta subunit